MVTILGLYHPSISEFQKALNFLYIFSYKANTVRKNGLKPLVPVALETVLPSKTVLVSLCAVENRDYWTIFEPQIDNFYESPIDTFYQYHIWGYIRYLL